VVSYRKIYISFMLMIVMVCLTDKFGIWSVNYGESSGDFTSLDAERIMCLRVYNNALSELVRTGRVCPAYAENLAVRSAEFMRRNIEGKSLPGITDFLDEFKKVILNRRSAYV